MPEVLYWGRQLLLVSFKEALDPVPPNIFVWQKSNEYSQKFSHICIELWLNRQNIVIDLCGMIYRIFLKSVCKAIAFLKKSFWTIRLYSLIRWKGHCIEFYLICLSYYVSDVNISPVVCSLLCDNKLQFTIYFVLCFTLYWPHHQ